MSKKVFSKLTKKWGVPILMLIAIAIIWFVNRNSYCFYRTTFESVINWFIAVVFAFILVRKDNNAQEEKHQIIKVLERLQSKLNDNSFFQKKATKEMRSIKAREIINILGLLNKISLIEKDDIKYIETNWNEWYKQAADCFDNSDFVLNTKANYERIALNIINKCDEIVFSLY